MNQEIRNKLRNVVTQCRRLLEDSISQELEGKYGIFAKKDQVTADPNAKMTHLTEEEQAARKDILDHFAHIQSRSFKPKDALDQLVREVAFTHLNRLCAYKMMEAREVYIGGQKFREAVSRGVKSNGFLHYLGMDGHEADERLYSTGQQDVAYRHFLDWLGGLLSEEIGVLFNPNDPANRLYPRHKTLEETLDLLNGGGIKADETELRAQWPQIWSHDETIGWVYQYFTPRELRDQARKESQAPRNSYELAFRNQFFTPRYVVEFLTDNTLGRIWYEMRKGDTKLKDECRYMVRRPTEFFLKDSEQPPKYTAEGKDDLSQEQLLKLPVHIPHRPKKDPRELKVLDPASGSGHFLLYGFDLLLTIYEEAYADPDLGPALQKDYPSLDDLLRHAPRLILAHNLHGIDIDLRASQIAALALWLRCQRAYRDMGLRRERPKITRSNFVCAEPMPGEESLFQSFVNGLNEETLRPLLETASAGFGGEPILQEADINDFRRWVECVWQDMRLASNAGSLLQMLAVEPRLQSDIRNQFRERFDSLFRDQVTAILGPSEAEAVRRGTQLVLELLKQYVQQVVPQSDLTSVLFYEDTVRGIGFLDVCRQEYDVVLMNPPFGDGSRLAKPYIDKFYPRTKNDLYAAFVERGLHMMTSKGLLGAITSRSGFFLTSFEKWREEVLLGDAAPTVFADLGYGVLDTAMVETAAYCLAKSDAIGATIFFRLLKTEDKESALCSALDGVNTGERMVNVFHVHPSSFGKIPGSPFAYWVGEHVRLLFKTLEPFESDDRQVRVGLQTSDDFRFLRCWWEVEPCKLLDARSGPDWQVNLIDFQAWCRRRTFEGKRWIPFAKGGDYSPFYSDLHLVVDWERDGEEMKAWAGPLYNNSGWSRIIKSTDRYFRPGITWPLRSQVGLSVRAYPAGSVFGHKGPVAFVPSQLLMPLLGLMNTEVFKTLVSLQMAFGSYEVGVIQRTPLPYDVKGAESATRAAVDAQRAHGINDERTHLFVLPSLCAFRSCGSAGQSLTDEPKPSVRDELLKHKAQLDSLAVRLYGVTSDDQSAMEQSDAQVGALAEDADIDDSPATSEDISVTSPQAVREMLSYAFGCILGRWDIRFATFERNSPTLRDPFDPLPVCSPGMLQGEDGQPWTRPVPAYPLRIVDDGILVEDADHPDDIVRQMREALQIIVGMGTEDFEDEACHILGVKGLRDYLRKPGKGGFWDDHVSHYAKSRRKAPIYWLLQSSKKNYALWLYYHRLDKDLLFKALVNYVEPKIRLETSRLETLRSQKTAAGESGKEAKRLAKSAEQQEDFLSELRDFEDKLRRAANLHLEPDLNDGVVLNIAPLHELVPWKEAKNYWDELLEGKYEWSSIGKQLRLKGIIKC